MTINGKVDLLVGKRQFEFSFQAESPASGTPRKMKDETD